jgi:RNA polymerase sigma-70 factor (ECF subfamily)
MAEAEQAVRRFLDGDENAFTVLVRQWESKVFNLAWRFLGNREDAQDATQETFISVYKSLGKLRDPKSFPSWLYRIALNQCRQRWRLQSSELSLDDPPKISDGVDRDVSLAPLLIQAERDPLEVQDLLRKSLMGISEDQRTALILKEYMGLTLEEIAQVMNCPLSTAKSRLYSGLRGVQRHLIRIGIRA